MGSILDEFYSLRWVSNYWAYDCFLFEVFCGQFGIIFTVCGGYFVVQCLIMSGLNFIEGMKGKGFSATPWRVEGMETTMENLYLMYGEA